MLDTVRTSLRHKTSETTEKGYDQVLEILNVARDIFVQEGYTGLSMRRVASRLGITLGALQHYYKAKDTLIEAVLLRMFDEIQNTMDRIATSVSNESAGGRFRAVMSFLIEYVESPAVQAMIFELSALAMRHTFATSTMERLFTNARRATRKLIRGLMPGLSERELSVRAALIVELLLGVMFFVGKHRPRAPELRNLESRTLQAMIDIAMRST